MIRLTRTYRFEAAHRLVSSQLSDAQNQATFGKCCREGGHGHNYIVDVTLEGVPDERSGMLLPRQDMDARVQRVLIDKVDHRNLNDVVQHDEVTTGENLTTLFWTWLEPEFPDTPRLVGVRVTETARNQFETTEDMSHAQS